MSEEIKQTVEQTETQQNFESLKEIEQKLKILEEKLNNLPDLEKIIENKLKNIYPPEPAKTEQKKETNQDEKAEKNIKITNELQEIKQKLAEQEKQKQIEKNKQAIEREAIELFKTAGLDFNVFKGFLNLDYENPENASNQLKQFYDNLVKTGIAKPQIANQKITEKTKNLVSEILKEKTQQTIV